MKRKLKILIGIILIITICMPLQAVKAASPNYGLKENRIEQNEKMYQKTNDMPASSLSRYYDKYLKDMFETNYKGMTTTQQKKIANLASTILSDYALTNEKEVTDLTDYEKLQAFNDWIRQKFYYDASVTSHSGYGQNSDNPYYILLYYNNHKGKTVNGTASNYTIARCNGFTSMFVALARNEGIAARAISGYYYPAARDRNDLQWGSKVTSSNVTHVWAQAYIKDEKRWITLDPNADCRKTYVKGKTIAEIEKEANMEMKYFDISAEDLSNTHIIFKFRPGSREVKYISDQTELKKMYTFLNKIYAKKTNGKRVNSSYNKISPATFFAKGETRSLGDGEGKFYKIYWPKNSLYGNLDLSGFTKLQNLYLPNNKVSSLYLQNCSSIATVNASGNKMTKIIVTGSAQFTLLQVQNNPATYVKYNFGKTKRTALIKAGTGGTVSVRYGKTTAGKYKHDMKAVAKKGYKFKGWYVNGKRISKYSHIAPCKTQSFTYIAKFVRK